MKVFAHRGASRIAPENTLAAISTALSLPVYGVEIDVYPVEDDYVVIHDRWLMRTASLHKRIDQISLAELRQLEAGIYQNTVQRVPLLSEVMALDWQNTVLNIELKQLHDAEHFCAYLQRHQRRAPIATEQLIISSFNHHDLAALAHAEPKLQRGWLTASLPLDYSLQAQLQGCDTINVDVDVVCKALVDDAKQRNLPVFVYTVDELDDIDMLRDMGVSGVFTNLPEVVLAHLNWTKEQN
ncbi:glycerophosphodiester phosphodiesterase [Alteromonas oceanisediminis]|uniref:glycerophosphodiester phosphodiesterase n=1 Tax=Alteromonas oceanisediminis TaxID=2836180 RepID=UPI001BDA07AD|nr:glycerophosphodiester phosphodiesterase family protein [Alteromonas oceanisediminis]MBT0586059.1 glycerophosphodiester phosphodiesterase [Alteromonas oceanisediminis]